MSSRVQQICEALVTELQSADASNAFGLGLETSRVYTTLLDLSGAEDTTVYVVPVHSQRKRTSNGTYRRDTVIEILVRQHLGTDSEIDTEMTDDLVTLLESIDDYLADSDNADLTLPDGTLASYVEVTDTRADADIRNGLGMLWLREHLQNLRQVTSVVRVAYAVDVSY